MPLLAPDEAALLAIERGDDDGIDCRCVLAQAEQLKPDYAEILRRVIMDGVTVTQVAGELGITPNNAMVRLHRARAALKAHSKRTAARRPRARAPSAAARSADAVSPRSDAAHARARRSLAGRLASLVRARRASADQPVAQQVVAQAAAPLSHEADCEDDCEDDCEEGDCCPAPGPSCRCCAHATALALAVLAIPGSPAPMELMPLAPDDLRSSGYVSPPFRPPTA